MKTYPWVTGEIEALRVVALGQSLARYGDGEFALARGRSIKCERGGLGLTERLKEILVTPHQQVLVGIPNIRSNTPKASYWKKYADFAAPLLSESMSYVSSFVTRPDSAPWVDTPEYWTLLESLWKNQDVTLVRGGGRSLTSADLTSAADVKELLCPATNAWADYWKILKRIERMDNRQVLLCLGPTATVLAYDLTLMGFHAIDLGHAGMFWRKHLAGEPLVRTESDKVAV